MTKNAKQTKQKPAKQPRVRRSLMIAGGVAVVVAVIFACWWYRAVYMAPQARYTRQAHAAYTRELKALGAPLAALGVRDVGSDKVKCEATVYYQDPTPRFQCSLQDNNYREIGKDAATYTIYAKDLDALLKQGGWKVTSNSASSLGQWFGDVGGGKDWYTDINAHKDTATDHCSLGINVAYSNPKPPAYTVWMNCTAPTSPSLSGGAFSQ